MYGEKKKDRSIISSTNNLVITDMTEVQSWRSWRTSRIYPKNQIQTVRRNIFLRLL